MSTVVQDLQRATAAINSIESKLISKGVIEQGETVAIEDYPDRIDEIGGGGAGELSIQREGDTLVIDDNTTLEDYAGYSAAERELFLRTVINNTGETAVSVELKVAGGIEDNRTDKTSGFPADSDTGVVTPACMNLSRNFLDCKLISKGISDTSKFTLVLTPDSIDTLFGCVCELESVFENAGIYEINQGEEYLHGGVDIVIPNTAVTLGVFSSAACMFKNAYINNVYLYNYFDGTLTDLGKVLSPLVAFNNNYESEPNIYIRKEAYEMFHGLQGINQLAAPYFNDNFDPVGDGSIELSGCYMMYATTDCPHITNLFIPTQAYGMYDGTQVFNMRETQSDDSIFGYIVNTKMREETIKKQLGDNDYTSYPLEFAEGADGDYKFPFCDYQYNWKDTTPGAPTAQARVLYLGDCCDEYIDHETIDGVEYTGWIHYFDHQKWADNLARVMTDKKNVVTLPENVLLKSGQSFDPSETIQVVDPDTSEVKTMSLTDALLGFNIKVITDLSQI